MDDVLLNSYLKFINNLGTAIRKISLYPPAHPAIRMSIKNIYAALTEILAKKDTITVSLSPDDKLIVENEPLNENSLFIADFTAFLRRLNVEDISFSSGITDKEVSELLSVVLLKTEQLKQLGDINKVLLDKGIQHVKTNQFSYIKVDKDEKPIMVKKEQSPGDILKARVQDLFDGKIQSEQEKQDIEKQVFNLISAEVQEKSKLGVSLKNLFKKFILYARDKDAVLLKLKNALLESGVDAQKADELIRDIDEEIARKRPSPSAHTPEGQADNLRNENEELKNKLKSLQETLDKIKFDLEEENHRLKRAVNDKQRLDNVMRHMAEGIVVVDPEGKIIMANPSAEKLLEMNKEDMGKSIKDVAKDEHLLSLVKKLSGGKEEMMDKDIELFSRNDSTKKVLRTSSAVIEDPNGNTIGMVTTLNDITKQKEIEELKSKFLASVSHELRTPLVAIDKSVSLMLDNSQAAMSPDQQKQFLSIAQRNLKRLSLLINDLLDLSKLEAGKMSLQREVVSIGKVINESVETLNNWAKAKAINIETKIQEGLPEINVDPNRLIQVLINLLGNAVKFTPDNGSITVSAILSQGAIEVSVSDTGIGIAKENIDKVFDKFYQIGEKAPTDVGGTGIGLAIAKEIVELHGGKISVESQKGQGTKFIFSLPLEVPAPES